MSLISAKDLFLKNTRYHQNQIVEIKKIHHGFTNESYLFIINDQNKFQVRLAGCNEIVSRENERLILNTINDTNYIYYDDKGNSIKKWIIGKHPNFLFNKKTILSLLSKEIKKLHSINVMNSKIIKHDYLEFFNQSSKYIKRKDLNIYIELINKYQNLELVLSHNDINPHNMLYNKKNNKVYLIDYEWGRLNNKYWDIANFFRETNLNIKWLKYLVNEYGDLDINIMYDFLLITTLFALQWTYAMPQTDKIIKYRSILIKKINKYKKIVEKYRD